MEQQLPTEQKIEKPKLGFVLIDDVKESEKAIQLFVRDFTYFTKHLIATAPIKDPTLDQINFLFAEFLDLKATEYIGMKDIELAFLKQKVAENTPASDAQKVAIKKLRDFYPELKNDFQVALQKAGLKSMTDEDMEKLTMDQAHVMMDLLAPLRKRLGYRDRAPDFNTGDKY